MVTYIKNKTNYGIAKSLNIGISASKCLGYQWVLTLDDDTLITKSYVKEMIDFYSTEMEDINNIGAIALTRDSQTNSQIITAQHYKRKRALITSGCLSHVSVFEAVKGFNEDLFIDLVDYDFCTKVRKKGYKIIQLSSIGMQHKVGNSVHRKFLGISLTVYNHAPFRLYYQVRNSYVFLTHHFTYDPLLSCYLLLDILKVPLKAIFFETQKFSRLGFALRGIKDGLVGRLGKIDV